MRIDPKTTNPVDVYQALVGLVTPRPIAWVSTVDTQGRPNLAPFSFFNVFSANPPVVVFSPTLRRDGTKKGTLLNIEATSEFVIHIPTNDLVESMNLTAKELPEGESEFDLAKLTPIPSEKVKPPRIQESPTALECKLQQIIPLGHGPIAGNLVIGEILLIHFEDRLLGADGKIDPHKMQSIGRLGGDYYARTTDLFALKRP